MRIPLHLALVCLTITRPLVGQSEHTSAAMHGIAADVEGEQRPYVTAGDRAYLIGSQDGDFPDMGGHVPGEMGGLWLHPIKLVDGFWAAVHGFRRAGRRSPCRRPRQFVNYPYGNRLRYGRCSTASRSSGSSSAPTDSRRHRPIQLTNASDREKRLELSLTAKTDLRPVWYSEKVGITDAPDTIAWQPAERVFVARDTGHEWYVVWGAARLRRAHHRPVTDAEEEARAGPPPTLPGVGRAPGRAASLTFIFAGSAASEAEALGTYRRLAADRARLLEKKKRRYAALLEQARVRIPDHRLQEVYDWVRVNMQWLVRDVPGIGRGLSGALMEYPWWFGTETYSLQALTATGDFELPRRRSACSGATRTRSTATAGSSTRSPPRERSPTPATARRRRSSS